MSYQSVTNEIPTDCEVISTPLGEMMTRTNAGRYLKAKYGFGTAAMLAQAATTGDGPTFHKHSATRSYYPVAGLDAWAVARLGEAKTTFKDDGRFKAAKTENCETVSA
jgi:hypothetical protein